MESKESQVWKSINSVGAALNELTNLTKNTEATFENGSEGWLGRLKREHTEGRSLLSIYEEINKVAESRFRYDHPRKANFLMTFYGYIEEAFPGEFKKEFEGYIKSN